MNDLAAPQIWLDPWNSTSRRRSHSRAGRLWLRLWNSPALICEHDAWLCHQASTLGLRLAAVDVAEQPRHFAVRVGFGVGQDIGRSASRAAALASNLLAGLDVVQIVGV